jgi:signal transduction histidine kinase/ActR/RegA family two-component response regulator
MHAAPLRVFICSGMLRGNTYEPGANYHHHSQQVFHGWSIHCASTIPIDVRADGSGTQERAMEVLLSEAINDSMSGHGLLQRSTYGATVLELAPVSNWRGMSESEHFVQFYETDTFLLDSLSGFIGMGLNEDNACIVVTTGAHRDGLEERLHGYGIDMNAARARGQYVVLDAAETLSKFMVDGSPEPGLFTEVIGGLIGRGADGWPRVRAFGEMVALLWAEGNHDGAIRLEELWNNLQKTHPFSLFCAYPMHGFGGEELAGPLSNVCTAHSRVIPTESYTSLTNADDRLRTIVQLQQKAGLLEAEVRERKEAEDALRSVKAELEIQVADLHRVLDEREQLLAREQLARAEAESANRLKDEFLATVSHELRTPLTAIIGWSHMLQTDLVDAASMAHGLATIERNAKAQAQLVEDILDVSRIITGKLRLNVESVDMASIINAAIDTMQLAADSKGIQLGVTLDPSARHISGDAGRLQQIIWNLLSNAIKVTPAGGSVLVRLERAEQHVQILVCDTGEGIHADFLPFIFDRFRQADASSTRRHGGLGLGLAIVRHLVELHGGTVQADSPGQGCGATFTIRLPLAAAPEQTEERRKEAERPWPNKETKARVKPLASLDGVKVLLVDDDQDTLNMLAVILADYRATVLTAATASEALEVLEWYRPDVLVSDLAMPGEDGYSLINKIRELKADGAKQIPAVALTANVRIEERAHALSAGFNMFVPKPVEPAELVTAILNLAEPGMAKS